MRSGKREIEQFEELPFFAHELLSGIPYTVEFVELKGGRKDMQISEIYDIIGFNEIEKMKLGPFTSFLFWLRVLIGRVFGWDDDKELLDENSYLSRLKPDELKKSVIEPGTMNGDTRILYCYERELLGEIINKTVHCFWLTACEQLESGYRLILAVYVKKLNWRTPIYMALVTPVLNWIIYPSIYKDIRVRWAKEFPEPKFVNELNSVAAAK